MTRPTRDAVMPSTSTLRSATPDAEWAGPQLFAAFSPGSTSPNEADERLSQLARTIECEIIPRLMLAHRAANECSPIVVDARRIEPADVAEFAKLVLAHGEDASYGCVKLLHEQGASIESLYLNLLAPTARHLGELWEQDLCDFTAVTVGLGRLQRVLRELSPSFQDGAPAVTPNGHRMLLLPCPGEKHTFGLVMVAEFFRRAGWQVDGGSWQPGSDAPAMASGTWYDVVGFSLATEGNLGALNGCIEAVRANSCNQAVCVVVGGPLFGLQPQLHERVGADLITADGRQAPALVERLLTIRPAASRSAGRR